MRLGLPVSDLGAGGLVFFFFLFERKSFSQTRTDGLMAV